jgi:hypothetical protein
MFQWHDSSKLMTRVHACIYVQTNNTRTDPPGDVASFGGAGGQLGDLALGFLIGLIAAALLCCACKHFIHVFACFVPKTKILVDCVSTASLISWP